MKDTNYTTVLLIPFGLAVLWLHDLYTSLNGVGKFLTFTLVAVLLVLFILILIHFYSPWGKENRKRLERLNEVPEELLKEDKASVHMGLDADLEENIYLPDNVRTRHIHILGATGSGKTESVILNFLRQDIQRGIGSIILDAKGDRSFLDLLSIWTPKEKLFVFDLTSSDSHSYNPLVTGSPLESAQRLFSSLTWSEEYYKSKALSALQRIFQTHYEINERNPTLYELAQYLETPDTYSAFVISEDFPQALALKEFQDISGLRDQVRSLSIGHLSKTLSPIQGIDLKQAQEGAVIYFRLQSLGVRP